MEKIRVTTSCRSRFYIFDQARELARHKVLYRLIADYPKSWPARYGVPVEKIHSLLFIGAINHGLSKVRRFIPAPLHVEIDKWVHNNFSRKLAKIIPGESQFFIGMSSFCLEALVACNALGIPNAVDHASIHQKENRRLVEDEANRWGVRMPNDVAADWVIIKEDAEFTNATHIFVPSTAARDSLARNGADKRKIFVNPYGVDLRSFKSGERSDDVFRVIQVGGVVLGKGVLTLLDAFLRAGIKNSELWFLGGGVESSGISAIIESMKTPAVTFHKPVQQASLYKYYQQCSVFVLASVADGFALVVLQAMACGLPVIVTENVGAKDLIVDGVNGFIVPVGAPEIIAERLRQLHEDPELRHSMGIAAKLTVEKGYTWQDYGDRLAEFLRNKVSV
jgi:glycosyltransferase involved in cell wall biosynthesis